MLIFFLAIIVLFDATPTSPTLNPNPSTLNPNPSTLYPTLYPTPRYCS